MKKLKKLINPYHQPPQDMTANQIWSLIISHNELIDLVNSQQEAIGELQTEIGVLRNMVLQSQEAIEKLEEHVDHEARHVSEQADDKPVSCRKCMTNTHIELCCPKSDTHRTVTLRIPKGMRIGEAMYEVWTEIIGDSYGILEISDTDLQKALDEVQPNE